MHIYLTRGGNFCNLRDIIILPRESREKSDGSLREKNKAPLPPPQMLKMKSTCNIKYKRYWVALKAKNFKIFNPFAPELQDWKIVKNMKNARFYHFLKISNSAPNQLRELKFQFWMFSKVVFKHTAYWSHSSNWRGVRRLLVMFCFERVEVCRVSHERS